MGCQVHAEPLPAGADATETDAGALCSSNKSFGGCAELAALIVTANRTGPNLRRL
jgi:hypothetical protein